jgi:hypothetical protein
VVVNADGRLKRGRGSGYAHNNERFRVSLH